MCSQGKGSWRDPQAPSNDQKSLQKVPSMTSIRRPPWVNWHPPSPCPLRDFLNTPLPLSFAYPFWLKRYWQERYPYTVIIGWMENWPDLRWPEWKIRDIHSVCIYSNTDSPSFKRFDFGLKLCPEHDLEVWSRFPKCTSDFHLDWWCDLLT